MRPECECGAGCFYRVLKRAEVLQGGDWTNGGDREGNERREGSVWHNDGYGWIERDAEGVLTSFDGGGTPSEHNLWFVFLLF